MGVASLVLDYLRSLVWPGVVIVAILVFRAELRVLLRRLKKIDGGPVGVEFEALQLQEQALKAVASPDRGAIEATGSDGETDARLRLLFDADPAWSVTALWGLLEAEVRKAAEGMDLLSAGTGPLDPQDDKTFKLIFSLGGAGLGREDVLALESARVIAAKAAADPSQIDGRIVMNYAESSRLAARALRELASSKRLAIERGNVA